MFRRATNSTSKTLATKTNTSKNLTRKKGAVSRQEINELIKKRAFEVYCRRGNFPGDEVGDWLVAESEVRKELGLR